MLIYVWYTDFNGTDMSDVSRTLCSMPWMVLLVIVVWDKIPQNQSFLSWLCDIGVYRDISSWSSSADGFNWLCVNMFDDKFYVQHMCNIDQWIYTLCYMQLFQGQNECNWEPACNVPQCIWAFKGVVNTFYPGGHDWKKRCVNKTKYVLHTCMSYQHLILG